MNLNQIMLAEEVAFAIPERDWLTVILSASEGDRMTGWGQYFSDTLRIKGCGAAGIPVVPVVFAAPDPQAAGRDLLQGWRAA